MIFVFSANAEKVSVRRVSIVRLSFCPVCPIERSRSPGSCSKKSRPAFFKESHTIFFRIERGFALKLILPENGARAPGIASVDILCFSTIRLIFRRMEKIGFGERRVAAEFPETKKRAGDPELRQTRADRYSSGEP